MGSPTGQFEELLCTEYVSPSTTSFPFQDRKVIRMRIDQVRRVVLYQIESTNWISWSYLKGATWRILISERDTSPWRDDG